MAKNSHAQGLALSELGHLYMTRGQLHDAKEMLEKAIESHRKAHNSEWEKYDAESLSAVISQIEEGSMM
jgi:uncharacterized protein HemY